MQFASALETRVFNLYKSSWIAKYYNFEVKSDDGTVYLFDPTTNSETSSVRFKIYVYIPEMSRPYFYSKNELKTISAFFETSLISNLAHGFRTRGFPATKSMFYKPPYFLKLINPVLRSSNCLMFNGFLQANSEETILAMLTYNDDTNNFVAEFSPEINIPFQKYLLLNKTLEFIITDSNRTQLLIEDNSQLYFAIIVKK